MNYLAIKGWSFSPKTFPKILYNISQLNVRLKNPRSEVYNDSFVHQIPNTFDKRKVCFVFLQVVLSIFLVLKFDDKGMRNAVLPS